MIFITIHVMIAVSALAYTSFLFFKPSPDRFNPAYWLLGATIGTGTILTITTGANILKTCLMGLAFVGVVSAGIIASKRKLAHQTQNLN